MNLMEAFSGISDRHIAEFADVKQKKRRITRMGMLISAAACLAVIIVIAAVPFIKIKSRTNEPPGALPHVYFNDRAYIIYSHTSGYACSELPDGYVLIGEITTNDPDNKKVNGYGEMLSIGEKIYQNPDFPEDVYVYTTLFNGNREYRYLLFTDITYDRVRINGKTYVRDALAELGERYLVDLPGGYVLIGEVTTNDRSSRYEDGFGQTVKIGDKIYGCSAHPDIVYVYTKEYLNSYTYVRFVAFEELI